ncbi:hypothetical protein HMPREF1640_06205 [Prevotella sp. S7-1-8]|nr:hypothetical protein HMPREF1640_06205 [Prevotella sp. S7-1-8]
MVARTAPKATVAAISFTPQVSSPLIFYQKIITNKVILKFIIPHKKNVLSGIKHTIAHPFLHARNAIGAFSSYV